MRPTDRSDGVLLRLKKKKKKQRRNQNIAAIQTLLKQTEIMINFEA